MMESILKLCLNGVICNTNIQFLQAKKYCQIEGVRCYSNLNINSNKNINIKKDKIHKFDMKQINKVNKYINEGEFKDIINSEFINLIDNKVTDNNFIRGYKLIDSIYDIESIDYGVVEDMNTINQIELEFLNKYKNNFINILNNLDEGKIYKLMFRWQTISSDYGSTNVQFNTNHAVFINKNSDVDVLLYKFHNNLVLFENKYGFSGRINLDIFIKEWINDKEFKLFQDLMNLINHKELKYKKEIEKNKNIVKGIKSNRNGEINSFFDSDFNKIKNVSIASNIIGLRYGDIVKNEYIKNYNIDNKINLNDGDELYLKSIKNNKYLVKVSKINNNENSVNIYLEKSLVSNLDYNIIELDKWVDKISYDDNNKIIVNRICENNGIRLEFIENDIDLIDINYNGKILLDSNLDYEYDDNIGVIDIETYKDSNNLAIPYAIGFKDGKNKKIYYIDNYKSSDDMVLDCINNMLIKENHNFKFYAHNMSEFDGILILKALMNIEGEHNYTYKIYSDNEGKIISIDITKRLANKKVIKISFLDSYLLLPFSLYKLGKVFNCSVNKGIFPYDFVNENTLLYSGKVPNFNFYSDISLKKYNKHIKIYSNGWSCKSETIQYLKKDLEVLYDVVHKFSKKVFKENKINITRIRTISGLAFLIFTSKYYNPKNNPIYYTNGKLEKFIREAYYGGIVDVLINYTDIKTYKYDVNSHYPYAMLNSMPGGKPTISNEKDLDKIFGFVEAIVTAPSKEELKVAILPVKLEGKTVLFRGTQKGYWFSEELKMARDFGYKIESIISCVKFEKIDGLFDDFVKDFYARKKEADINKNEIERLIFKLLLNSLYGRLGINSNNINLKVLNNNKVDKILKTEDSDILYKSKFSSLVKSKGPLDPEILRIISNEKLFSKSLDFSDLNSRNPWSGVSSSVHLSAAITAYGRMFLNKFKNMKDNEYLGGDTDSIILSKPLDDLFVGDTLGKFKLEHVIIEGFYLSKKFYLLVTEDNKIIIKCKGINNKNNVINYESFIELFKGKSLFVEQTQFNLNYKDLDIGINKKIKEIKGIENKEIKNKLENRKLIIYNS